MFTSIEGKDGAKTEIAQAVYKFASSKGDRKQVTIYDLDIIESTEKIKAAMTGRNILSLVICKELSNIAESGKLEKLGFKTIAEYGHYLFGLQTSTVNHYARIGKNFLNDDYSVKGGLPELSVSHFIELNALVPENGDLSGILELFVNGTLSDGMSTKDFRNALKGGNSATKIEDKSASTNNETSTNGNTATVNNETSGDTYNVENYDGDKFDVQVVVGQILNKCNDIVELFALLNKHEITAVGYEESIDVIKGLAKALIK